LEKGFPKLNTIKKSGDERFSRNSETLDLDILSFWRWSASDLVSNATRGILAEYIVATALGSSDGLREEWDAFDHRTKDNIKIEVKPASYIQSWQPCKSFKDNFWHSADKSLGCNDELVSGRDKTTGSHLYFLSARARGSGHARSIESRSMGILFASNVRPECLMSDSKDDRTGKAFEIRCDKS
jgi:hypothetical protein